MDRLHSKSDTENEMKSEVIIKDNAFLGPHSTISEGVAVGKNSVIGACPVVAKSVSSNKIRVGNPVKFIRKI